MHLSVSLPYPASVAAVAALLCDESFVHWRAEHSKGDGGIDQVDLTGTLAEGFSLIVHRTLPTTVIPAQFRSFVGDHLSVRQAEVWEPSDGTRLQGTVAVEISGAPVRLTGTMVVETTADGCRHVYDSEVKAAIPLFGGIIEEAAGKAVRAALEAESKATVEWLASHQ